MKRLEEAIWRMADVVSYPTLEEIQVVNEFDRTISATALQIYCYDSFASRQSAITTENLIFVGNYKHAPNVDAVLWFAGEVFPLVLSRYPNARFLVAGGNAPIEITSIQHPSIDVLGWLDEADLGRAYDRSRAVVVPLRFGAGLKLKVIEAMASGVPLVTTNVGAQGIASNDFFLPADTPEQIADAIDRVFDLSDSDWLLQARSQVEYCETHYSRAGMLNSLQNTLNISTAVHNRKRVSAAPELLQ